MIIVGRGANIVWISVLHNDDFALPILPLKTLAWIFWIFEYFKKYIDYLELIFALVGDVIMYFLHLIFWVFLLSILICQKKAVQFK
jgi:hypothetical protein